MLALSPTVLAEVAEVLHRPELRQKLRRLTPERVDDLLQALVNEALLVPAPPRHIELPRDPKDEPYLDLAIAAGASYLITRDKDLLDLMNLDHKEGQEFRQRFPDLRIVNPVDYLNSVSSRLDSEQP